MENYMKECARIKGLRQSGPPPHIYPSYPPLPTIPPYPDEFKDMT
jgi:hypothetical protein